MMVEPFAKHINIFTQPNETVRTPVFDMTGKPNLPCHDLTSGFMSKCKVLKYAHVHMI